MYKFKALLMATQDKNIKAFQDGFKEVFLEKVEEKCLALEEDVNKTMSRFSVTEKKCKEETDFDEDEKKEILSEVQKNDKFASASKSDRLEMIKKMGEKMKLDRSKKMNKDN